MITKIEVHEASDLGWRPGYWPENYPDRPSTVLVKLERDEEGDVLLAKYWDDERGVEVHVLND